MLVHHLVSPPPDDPARVATIGTAGGLGSWLLTWLAERMDTLDHLIGLLTHCVGLCVAILTLALLMRRWRASRETPPREPHDVDDDFPQH